MATEAAASARLCVETSAFSIISVGALAAASARLCVETVTKTLTQNRTEQQPPPRGCVLKHKYESPTTHRWLAAASARLCVETLMIIRITFQKIAAASVQLCI